jgi:sensor histidine kinase YesM
MNSSYSISSNPTPFAVSFSKSIRHWLFKYKLYHIPFWCIYHFIWAAVKYGNPLELAGSIFFSPKFIFYVIFQAVAVYFNLYFLIPRYLEKSRFPEYILYLLITVLCTASLIVPGYYLSAFLANSTTLKLYGTDEFSYFFMTYTLTSTMASMTFAMSIKLTKNWIETKRRQQLLEKEKLETELKFLKYQFNPHFLFNTINSIFFLIHKNPDMASASLAKFSELLRYQLYECNDVQISLSKEITYLQNFIELEKLRQSKTLMVTLDINEQQTNHLGIAPFILMTFVENAFKHVSKDKDKANWINIQLKLDQQRMEFEISNSTSQSISTDVVSYGGIGLQNVQRRLDLLYADQYDLAIQSTNNCFEVKLRLHLSELVAPAPHFLQTIA